MPLPRNRAIVPRQVGLARTTTLVPYLTLDDVRQLEAAASQNRKGERDALMTDEVATDLMPG